MNWRKWLAYNPYKKLWFWAGRPFTYIIRDTWYKAEFVWIISLVAVGVWLGHQFDWLEVIRIMVIFTIGFIAGHLFWGKKYVEGQREVDNAINRR